MKNYKYDVLVPKITFAKYVDTDVVFTANTTANNYALSQQQNSIDSLKIMTVQVKDLSQVDQMKSLILLSRRLESLVA